MEQKETVQQKRKSPRKHVQSIPIVLGQVWTQNLYEGDPDNQRVIVIDTMDDNYNVIVGYRDIGCRLPTRHATLRFSTLRKDWTLSEMTESDYKTWLEARQTQPVHIDKQTVEALLAAHRKALTKDIFEMLSPIVAAIAETTAISGKSPSKLRNHWKSINDSLFSQKNNGAQEQKEQSQ
jgi:hypothetical protein